MIASTILSFLSLGWKGINALSNTDWLLQSAGVKPEVARFLASSRGSDLLVAFTLALLVLSLVFTYERTAKQGTTPSPDAQADEEQSHVTPDIEKQSMASEGKQPEGTERILVKVTPDYLIGLMHDNLTVEAERRIKPYLGKWLSISGTVYNVYPPEKGLRVYIEPVPTQVRCSLVLADFDAQKWAGRIEVLRRGESISILGQLARVQYGAIDLKNCEIIATEST